VWGGDGIGAVVEVPVAGRSLQIAVVQVVRDPDR
jgi:hypothetical protein